MYVHNKQYNQLNYTQFAILNFRKLHYNLNMFPTTYTEGWNVQYWDFPNWIRKKFSVALAFRIYTNHFLAVDVSISWLDAEGTHGRWHATPNGPGSGHPLAARRLLPHHGPRPKGKEPGPTEKILSPLSPTCASVTWIMGCLVWGVKSLTNIVAPSSYLIKSF
jgi:hypothetical protein